MKTRGKLTRIEVPYKSRTTCITFEVETKPEHFEELQEQELDIEVKKHRKRRSLDANAMLWACLGEMAEALGVDNWSMYLFELERYGKYEHILVRPDAVNTFSKAWRDTKIVGKRETVDDYGNIVEMTDMLCFYGSSTYDSKEFSRLLDGVVSDMKSLHLVPPPSGDMKRALKAMEKSEDDKTNRSKEERKSGKE